MGILSDTRIADAGDAEAIAEDEDFCTGKYKTCSAKGLTPEVFDRLLFILRGKKRRVKPLPACKLVYQSSDEGPWMYQFKDELIDVIPFIAIVENDNSPAVGGTVGNVGGIDLLRLSLRR